MNVALPQLNGKRPSVGGFDATDLTARRRRAFAGKIFAPRVLAFLLVASPLWVQTASAQSAADKATARELASDGIKKFNAGNAKAALKSLQKAQALYNAPIHLLYIARAQVQLGQLIEGVETYRSLLRIALGPDDPEVFHNAQREAEKEIETVVPRLARLTLEITPEEVEGLRVEVDGQAVKSAALSVARPSNPGEHVAEVWAPGFKPASQTIHLEEGGAGVLHIQLEKDPGYRAADAKAEPAADAEKRETERDWRDSGAYGFIVGLRYGGALPLGDLEAGEKMSDYYAFGGYGQVEVGFRFLHHFGAKVYAGGSFLLPGTAHNAYARSFSEEFSLKTAAKTGDVGFSLLVTSNPRRFGGFGEIGMSFLHGYEWKREIAYAASPNDALCHEQVRHSGVAGRVGVGGNLPVHRLLSIVPSFNATVGSLDRGKAESSCGAYVGAEFPEPPFQFTDSSTSIHYQLFFGIGIDMHFGDSWFEKRP